MGRVLETPVGEAAHHCKDLQGALEDATHPHDPKLEQGLQDGFSRPALPVHYATMACIR